MFFTGISDQDASFGQGEEVEENTFAVQPDKILHFFTLDDLKVGLWTTTLSLDC